MELVLAIYIVFLFYVFVQLCKRFWGQKNGCCYMLNYQCYKATDERKLATESSCRVVLRNKNLGLDEYKFLLKAMVSSGIGEETYSPKSFIMGREENPCSIDSLEEMDDIFFDTFDNLFAKSGISPQEIDTLVVNVSLLSSVPSLTSRIINQYKMKSDIKAFNLSGMGCSVSLIATDLVSRQFKIHKKAFAIVVSTESFGANWYCGKEKSMMLSNCLFRSGSCSMLFTKKTPILNIEPSSSYHLWYALILARIMRHMSVVSKSKINQGYQGFRLTKKLTKAAAQAFIINLRDLLPKILPLWELIRYAVVHHRWSKEKSPILEGVGAGLNRKSGVDHFCIHPGGRAVIDGVGNSPGLTTRK